MIGSVHALPNSQGLGQQVLGLNELVQFEFHAGQLFQREDSHIIVGRRHSAYAHHVLKLLFSIDEFPSCLQGVREPRSDVLNTRLLHVGDLDSQFKSSTAVTLSVIWWPAVTVHEAKLRALIAERFQSGVLPTSLTYC